jgi:glycolate oxidase iron-sulfur subunit
MQTAFSPRQLTDPQMRESEKILRTCVHCGFCTATCPTYLLLGDELDSPRGRIYLIKDMLENDRPATAEVVTHIDRCLSCLSCMTTCPSGVNYMHLVDHARTHIEKTYRRPLLDRALRFALAKILPYPARFRRALRAARPAASMRSLLAALPGGDRLNAMLALAPPAVADASPLSGGSVFPADGPRRARVALLQGCAQSVLAPEINEAAIRLLTRTGVEVVLAREEGCCGALVHHLGRESEALDQARRNVDAWSREIADAGLDAIIITASGCGTTVKDYGFMLREDDVYAERAARVAALARDVTEFLAAFGMPTTGREMGIRIAYHSACSMQHGQQIREEPKALLAAAGFTVRDIPESHICCGSAGTYNILQPEIASRLRDRKAGHINAVPHDVVATGNIGCMTQLRGALTAPIVHTVELLDWATGGPRPRALADGDLWAAGTNHEGPGHAASL